MKTILIGKLFFIKITVLFVVSCSSSVKIDEKLNGKSIQYIKERIGTPFYEKDFILSKTLYEYQYELLSYYPQPNGKNIQIKELGWNKKNKKIVIWFHKINNKWISFCNTTWDPDKIQF